MWKLVAFIYDSIREGLGSPASLYRLLETRPDLRTALTVPPQVIAAESVVKWHEWGTAPNTHGEHCNRGELMGWRHSPGSYSSCCVRRDEFANFGSCEITEEWECDIQDITGLSSSKSELTDFASLDAMIEANSREMIDAITEEKLRENLAHDEIRILHRDDPSDFFVRHLWDGRVFLINNGGSHHFAAARYIASRLGIPVPLCGKLHTYSINQIAVARLERDFDMFVISDTGEGGLGFHGAMESFRATYLWQFLPRPYGDQRAILLPKLERRSAKVAAVLREAGYFDLGAYLRGLVMRQIQNESHASASAMLLR